LTGASTKIEVEIWDHVKLMAHDGHVSDAIGVIPGAASGAYSTNKSSSNRAAFDQFTRQSLIAGIGTRLVRHQFAQRFPDENAPA
jgi:hypothetical protein